MHSKIRGKQEIEPEDLKKKIDNDENIFLLDVRTPQEYDAWRISYDKYVNPKLIPVDRLFVNDPTLLKEIPKDKEIVTVCAHGNRSLMAANILNQLGYNVKSVKGGMAGWNKVYDVAEIPVPKEAPFQIWQIRRISKGCMGYIISSKEDKLATVIDPSREIYEAFLKTAKDNGLQIIKLLDTHQHADHVSGIVKLIKTITTTTEPNAELMSAYFSSLEDYDSSNSQLKNISFVKDGDRIDIGNKVTLKAIYTPGHTNGSMSFLLDYSISNNNMNNDINDNNPTYSYLFTGDTLFVDGVGRPDLRDQSLKFAELLFDTYHQKILQLHDDTKILPAHFNGTSVALKHTVPIYETIGAIKKKINLLSMDKNEFIKYITNTVPPRPMNYKTIVSINKKMLPYDEIEMPDLEAGPNSCMIS
ncbi:MAG TPA: rhodanese-like domain-containing protein [Nitrososphaeraceae archaeon]|nr:rhodanese-like domain-containing protein [Nitrososphaeraceae archaeon]